MQYREMSYVHSKLNTTRHKTSTKYKPKGLHTSVRIDWAYTKVLSICTPCDPRTSVIPCMYWLHLL